MIIYKFAIYIILLITFIVQVRKYLYLLNLKNHDTAMFDMAELRREIIRYLMQNKDRISKQDARYALNLIRVSSYTISNHDILYGKVFNFKGIKESIIFSKKEIDEEVDPIINSVKNKTIKNYYQKFGFVIFKNISKNIYFFKYRLVFTLFFSLLSLFMRKKKEEYSKFLEWFDSKKENYSKNLIIN